MTNKLGAGHLTEGHTRTLEDQLYAEAMAQALRERRPEPRNLPTHFNGKPVKELSEGERQEFILSLQPLSTQAVLRRDPKDDESAWNRPLPPKELWKREVVHRQIEPHEYDAYKSMQRSSKNELGASMESSVDSEKREKGIWAFTYSKPANPSEVDVKRLTSLTEMKAVQPESLPPPPAPKKTSWWRRLLGLEPEESSEGEQLKRSVAFKGNAMVIRTERDDAERD